MSSFDAGGTERQMTELVRRLDPRRFAVHVVCFRREGVWRARVEERAASVTEFRLTSLRALSTVRQMIRFARWCRERRIAVVHACDIYANIFALPAAALARVPVRVGGRRGIVSPVGNDHLLTLQRFAYRAAHRIVANSGAAAQRVIEEGVPAWKIATIPNGIDVQDFPRAERRAARRVITTVANLRAGKGHDVLLRAAALVVRRVPEARFQFVGSGPLRASLEPYASHLGLADHVRFVGHRDDVPAILQQSDIFAFPSLMEAFPNGVIEAMAVGLPVVATRVGGIPELIEDEHNGLLVPAGDDGAMAHAIVRLIEDEALAASLGAAAHATVEARYSFARMVGEFEALYLDELEAREGVFTWAASSAN
jgi:glycosyltransferase involved in cell wall biosynthesis